METKVFYAWQGDLPARVTRNLIHDAATIACDRISEKFKNRPKVVVDQAAQGVPGMCDIPNVILSKINDCDVFLPDVSFINQSGSAKRMSNPNVLFELGYAARAKGFDRILAVMNTAFGGPKDQMFDVKRRWALRYNLADKCSDEELAKAQEKLADDIQELLEVILEQSVWPSTRADLEDRFKSIRESFEGRVSRGEFGDVSKNKGTIAICIVPEHVANFEHEQLRASLIPPPGRTGIGWNCESYGKSVLFSRQEPTDESRTDFVCYEAAEIRPDGVTLAADSWNGTRPGAPSMVETDYMASLDFESLVIDWILDAGAALKTMGLQLPWRVGISLINIKGFQWLVGSRQLSKRKLLLDDLACDPVDFTSDEQLSSQHSVARVLRPAFDFVWRSFGFEGSRSYNANGDWHH